MSLSAEILLGRISGGAPWKNAFNITPSDVDVLEHSTSAIILGGGDGTLRVDMVGGGEAVDFAGLITGEVYRIQVTKIHATGTASTGIVGLY